MKQLDWKELNFTWWDDNQDVASYDLIIPSKLTFDDIAKYYEVDFHIRDEDGVALNLDDIKNILKELVANE